MRQIPAKLVAPCCWPAPLGSLAAGQEPAPSFDGFAETIDVRVVCSG